MNPHQEKSLPTSEADMAAQVTALAHALLGQCADQHHNLALSALLTAYTELAMRNACCTQACANQAMRVAMQLARHASEVAPHGAPIH